MLLSINQELVSSKQATKLIGDAFVLRTYYVWCRKTAVLHQAGSAPFSNEKQALRLSKLGLSTCDLCMKLFDGSIDIQTPLERVSIDQFRYAGLAAVMTNWVLM